MGLRTCSLYSMVSALVIVSALVRVRVRVRVRARARVRVRVGVTDRAGRALQRT